MPVVSIFSGIFCHAEPVADALRKTTGYALLTDNDIVERASALSSIPEKRLWRCFTGRSSVFNPFTRELERSLSWLKLGVAEHLQETSIILNGYISHLIPPEITHVVRVCLIAETPYRISNCIRSCNIPREEAARRIAGDDRQKSAWVQFLNQTDDPWEPSLYDMVLPTRNPDTEKILAWIRKGIHADAVAPSASSRKAAADFLEASRIEAALAEKGHAVGVKKEDNAIIITIDRPVMMFERLEKELTSIAGAATGNDNVIVRIEAQPDKNEVYRPYRPEAPSRVLLVDDEREFVQTLSERLEMRDIGSAVAFDGESALEILKNDEPDVMLLDLQMPGINGIEVLRTVKKIRPEIEVIVLTGHGTEKDRDACMQLGAFSYLEKPVDIDVLSQTLHNANEKMRQNRKGGSRQCPSGSA